MPFSVVAYCLGLNTSHELRDVLFLFNSATLNGISYDIAVAALHFFFRPLTCAFHIKRT